MQLNEYELISDRCGFERNSFPASCPKQTVPSIFSQKKLALFFVVCQVLLYLSAGRILIVLVMFTMVAS